MTENLEHLTDNRQDLLWITVALRLGLASPEQLAAGLDAANQAPSRPLAETMVALGFIDNEKRGRVDQEVLAELDRHQGDVDGALNTLKNAKVMLESIGPISIPKPSAPPEPPRPPAKGALESFGGVSLSKNEGPVIKEVIDSDDIVTISQYGRYTIKSEKGRGGIGRVLIAVDTHLGREVALKELLPEITGSLPGATPSRVSTVATSRFLMEARITGQLEHPGIIPIYELGKRPDGSYYYTMRLVRGMTLARRIDESKTLNLRLRLLHNFLELVNAIAYAHSKGVIHRDLKPQNVMVGEFGETIVLDWGLAKVPGGDERRDDELEEGLKLIMEAEAGETVTGKPIGTPSYMPPEQADGRIEDIDERSDIYSLGAVLFEILTGRPPFTGDNAYAVLGMVLSDPVPPIASLEPQVPPELAAIAEKCLAKDRNQRYQTAREVAEDVVKFQTGGMVSAYEYSAAAVAAKWVRKHWAVIGTAAVALIVLVSLGVLSYFSIRAEKDEALAQKHRAELQEKAAHDERAKALGALAEAFAQYGLRAERDRRYNDAALFFGQALQISGREQSRDDLFRILSRPIHLTLRSALEAGAGSVSAARWLPGGKQLLAAGCSAHEEGACVQSELRLWSEDGQVEQTFIGMKGAVSALAVSPDGKEFVTGGCGDSPRPDLCIQGELKRWSIKKGEYVKVFTGHSSAARTVAYSPDGAYLLSGGCAQQVGLGCFAGEALLWPIEGEEPELTLSGHQGLVNVTAFSPDGKFLLTGGADKTLKVWRRDNGALAKTFAEHSGPISAAVFLPDGKSVLSAACGELSGTVCKKGELKLWALEGEEPAGSLFGRDCEIAALAVSPDGSLAALAACAEQNADGVCVSTQIKLRDLADRGRTIDSIAALDGTLSALDFSFDSKELLSAGANKQIKLWHVYNPTGVRVLAGLHQKINAVDVSEDGKLAAAVDAAGGFAIWPARTGENLLVQKLESGAFQTATFSADGGLLIGAGMDGSIKAFAVDGGAATMSFQGHDASITTLSTPQQGDLLLSGGLDKVLKLWDLKTGTIIRTFTGHANVIMTGAIFADGGRAVSTSMEMGAQVKAVIMVWDVNTGQVLSTIDAGPNMIVAVAVAPGGKLLAGAGADKSVRIWKTDSGSLVRSLEGHGESVSALSWCRNGRYLASGGTDGVIKIWEAASYDCILTFAAHEKNVSGLAFAPDGTYLVSGGWDGKVMAWPFPPGLLERDNGRVKLEVEKNTGLTLDGFEVKLADADQ